MGRGSLRQPPFLVFEQCVLVLQGLWFGVVLIHCSGPCSGKRRRPGREDFFIFWVSSISISIVSSALSNNGLSSFLVPIQFVHQRRHWARRRVSRRIVLLRFLGIHIHQPIWRVGQRWSARPRKPSGMILFLSLSSSSLPSPLLGMTSPFDSLSMLVLLDLTPNWARSL